MAATTTQLWTPFEQKFIREWKTRWSADTDWTGRDMAQGTSSLLSWREWFEKAPLDLDTLLVVLDIMRLLSRHRNDKPTIADVQDAYTYLASDYVDATKVAQTAVHMVEALAPGDYRPSWSAVVMQYKRAVSLRPPPRDGLCGACWGSGLIWVAVVKRKNRWYSLEPTEGPRPVQAQPGATYCPCTQGRYLAAKIEGQEVAATHAFSRAMAQRFTDHRQLCEFCAACCELADANVSEASAQLAHTVDHHSFREWATGVASQTPEPDHRLHRDDVAPGPDPDDMDWIGPQPEGEDDDPADGTGG